MQHKTIQILLLSIALLSACMHNKQTEGDIEPVDLLKVEEPPLSFFFKAVDLIQLEGKDSAYLNASCLSSYFFAEDKLYVMDQANKSVVVFNSDGSWEETIRRYGRGPQEYVMMTDMAFNAALRSIDILEATGAIISYSLDPPHPMIRRFKMPRVLRGINHFIPYGTGYYLFSGYEEAFLHYLDTESGELTEILGIPDVERNLRAGYATTGSPFYLFKGQVYYVDGASGSIFELEGGHARPYLGWDYGSYQFRPENVNTQRTGGSYEELLKASSSMAGPVALTRETDRYVFTNVLFLRRWLNVVFDKETGKKTVFVKMKEGVIFSPGCYFDNAIYTLIPPEVVGQFLPSDTQAPKDNSNYLIIRYSL